jgi:hypothetical protein
MKTNGVSTYAYYVNRVPDSSPSGTDAGGAKVYTEERGRQHSPAYTVTISEEALRRNNEPVSFVRDGAALAAGAAGADATSPSSGIECQTCKNRKYQDVSNDSTVSFQTPTKVSPGAAESLVRSHEMEHVNHEQAKAKESGQKVVLQSVAIHYGICPECGRSFVSGGTTTTVARSAESSIGSTTPERAQTSISIRV